MFKNILTSMVLIGSLAASAQQNNFHDRKFWKTKPDVATVKKEIAAGSNPTQLNENAFDATVYALIENAPNETVKFLLSDKGNPVNKMTHDGRTYLHWAAYAGNSEMVKYLLDNASKIDVLDDHGYSPLNFAAANGQKNTEVYDLLIAKGADPKKDLDHHGANAMLLVAPHSSDYKLIDYFLKKGLNIDGVDADGNSAFNYAAKTGNVEYLGSLIKKGVPYNNNAFLMASQGTRGTSNTIETYKFLKSLYLNPDATGKNGENAIHNLARKEGQLDIIKWFIENGADVNLADKDGNTPLINASGRGDLATITFFADHSKDLNKANSKGVTALVAAVRSNSPEMVKYLLSKGAKVDVADANGDNLSSYLVQSYNPKKPADFEEKLKALEAAGFKFASAQPNGNTLYHLAIAKNDMDLLKKVSAYKIDVNAANKEGLTPLHKAAMTSKDDVMLKYLLSIGAKKSVKTDMGETSYDLASENEALTKAGVNVKFLKS